jgi:HEPN domain-containing protein
VKGKGGINMQKNARRYVQDSYSALETAKSSLEHALKTAEKGSNQERIQHSLQSVEAALQQCGQTVDRLEKV